MVLVFVDDASLAVHANRTDASRLYEGIDVESGVYAFYRGDGIPLTARFVIPNKKTQIFGAVGWVTSGTFELVENPGADQDPIALSLLEAAVLQPNEYFRSLAELQQSTRAQGVKVDYEPQSKHGEA